MCALSGAYIVWMFFLLEFTCLVDEDTDCVDENTDCVDEDTDCVDKGNNKITELRTILQRVSQNS
jgi:hypothetical protein